MIRILATLFLPMIAQAIGLTVTPSAWNVSLMAGDQVTQNFQIINSEEAPLRYRIWTDETAGIITFVPSEFVLNPGEQAEIEARLYFESDGQYDFDISILADSLEQSGVAIGSGVHIPVSVSVSPQEISRDSMYTFLLISAGVVLLLILFVIIRFARLSY